MTSVPAKDVQNCEMGVKTLIWGEFTGETAAVGKEMGVKTLIWGEFTGKTAAVGKLLS